MEKESLTWTVKNINNMIFMEFVLLCWSYFQIKMKNVKHQKIATKNCFATETDSIEPKNSCQDSNLVILTYSILVKIIMIAVSGTRKQLERP